MIQEITILGPDESEKLRTFDRIRINKFGKFFIKDKRVRILGFTVKEQIGIGIININAISKLKV